MKLSASRLITFQFETLVLSLSDSEYTLVPPPLNFRSQGLFLKLTTFWPPEVLKGPMIEVHVHERRIEDNCISFREIVHFLLAPEVDLNLVGKANTAKCNYLLWKNLLQRDPTGFSYCSPVYHTSWWRNSFSFVWLFIFDDDMHITITITSSLPFTNIDLTLQKQMFIIRDNSCLRGNGVT